MPNLPPSLFKRWFHSQEEDADGILVYRPADYPFPPARGRTGIEFRENGEFVNYAIGPTDRTQATVGRWTDKGSGVIEVSYPNNESGPSRLTIESVDNSVLKVRS